jgi:hypothetical protein
VEDHLRIEAEIAKRRKNSTMYAVLARIEKCESGGNPLAKNPNSSASGLYQFIHSSWVYYGTKLWGSVEDKDVFNPHHNRELAEYVYRLNGTRDWLESAHCWNI